MSSLTVASDEYTHTQRVIIIASCMLGFALDLYDILILPFLMPAIQAGLRLGLTEVASLTSLALIGSMIGGWMFGQVGDRWGRKTALQWSLGTFAIGSLLSAAAWNYPSLVGFRIITGIGLGGEWGAGMVLFNEAFKPVRRGLGGSVIQGMAVVAASSASIVGIWAVSSFDANWGWRVGLLTGAAPLLLMIFVRFWMPESRAWLKHVRETGLGPGHGLSKANRPRISRMFDKDLRAISTIAFVWMTSYMFCYYSVVVFMPTLMLKVLGTPAGATRTASIAMSIASGISYVSMGWLNDRRGRRIGAVAPVIMWLASLAGLYVWGTVRYEGSLLAWPLFWIFIAFGIGNTALGVAGTWLSELYPIDVRATAVSTIYMVGRGVGSIAPVVVPLVAAATGGKLVNGMMTALPAAVLFLSASLLLPETWGRRRSADLPSAIAGEGLPASPRTAPAP